MNKTINYIKTGDGTASATLGYENGPLQKWVTQPTNESGFESTFDFGTDILTTLQASAVFNGFTNLMTTSNVYNFPRGERFDPNEDIKSDYTLTQPTSLEARSGEFDNVVLDNIMRVGKAYQRFEITGTGANYFGFEMAQAMRGQALRYENYVISDLFTMGTDGATEIVESADGKIDIYATILNLQARMLENGTENLGNVDIYCSARVLNAIMKTPNYIANQELGAEEVRIGFKGMFLGFRVIVSGRMGTDVVKNKAGVVVPTNLIMVDRTQVYCVRNIVQGLAMNILPAPYIDTIALQGLEYFKHYLVNAKSCYNLTLDNTKL